MIWIPAALKSFISGKPEVNEAFLAYCEKYGKNYQTSEEFYLRQSLYLEKDAIINEWNSREGVTSTMGHNMFSDWTEYEHSRKLRKRNAPKKHQVEKVYTEFPEDIPDSVNWVAKGGVSAVKNMLLCEANWAFAGVGTIEGSYFAKHGKYIELSAQQCIDCDTDATRNWDNCDGGWADDCIQYSIMGNLATAADFPYQHMQQKGCQESSKPGPIKTLQEGWVKYNSPNDLKAAIAQQPVVVYVDSGEDVFKMYKGGIISDAKACGQATDEPLLAVGYGKDEKTGAEYYLVKNNFGTDWGEEGYVRIGIQDGAGVCGIQSNPQYAIAQ